MSFSASEASDVEEEEEYDSGCDMSSPRVSEEPTMKAMMMMTSDHLPPEVTARLQQTCSQSRSELFMVLDIVLQNTAEGGMEVVLMGQGHHGSRTVLVEGWYPYLYVEAPPGWTAESSDILMQTLNTLLSQKKQRSHCGSIRSIEIVSRKNILGYSSKEPSSFLKIRVMQAYTLRRLRELWEGSPADNNNKRDAHPGMRLMVDGLMMGNLEEGRTQTYNAHIDPVLQFMVDVDLMGCQWVRVPVDDARVRVEDLQVVPLEEMSELGALRVLSFDIEAAGRRGVFPQAQHDPVIQIAVHFAILGATTIPPILLSLHECDAIEGATVMAFENEAHMLLAFRDIVRCFDCDVLSGYNICNFDFLYLLDRAVALGVGDQFEQMSRWENGKLQLRETVYESMQTGKRKRVRVMIPGRVCLDMLTCIQNNQSYRLERYTLNAVSAYFLGDQKVDLPFTQITPMWERDSAARRELGIYCLKDAQLPLDLMSKLDGLTQTLEMARCTGIPFDWVLQRGVMIRNASLLLRRAKARGFVFPHLVPSHQAARQQRFEGATVLEAQCGIHHNVGVLDFSSMYPSIIRAHNLCYSTIVLDETPRGAIFEIEGVKYAQEVKGLLPEVVEILQECRSRAKAAYAVETDPLKKKTCKAREMAFKVAGNGMYGALGSQLSLLPLLEVAKSVTAIGRQDIRRVKGLAESLFRDDGVLVVYGDTDSVFVRFAVSCGRGDHNVATRVQEVMGKAKFLAERVNQIMRKPKKIEFEKVYSTMLLLSKKRYAGVMYTDGHKWDGKEEPPIDIKGMQCVRRDGCPLVRDLVKDCLLSILQSGDIVEAATLARRRLMDVVEDKVSLEAYAVQKVLRKTMQDCCFPMDRRELREIRQQLQPSSEPSSSDKEDEQQLTYAEQDEAIRRKIRLPWKTRVTLPHVMLAWKLRKRDPGSAPVLGESIRYIVTRNGECHKKVWEKVETLEDVEQRKMVVDRRYYLDALKVPLANIFLPVCMQRLANHTVKAKAEVERLLWDEVRGKALKTEAATRRASIEASPLMQAFKRQKNIREHEKKGL